MKIYIICDIEGIAGVVFYCMNSNTLQAHDLEMRNRTLMTEEVNAAARGAFNAGADEVYVHDHHGVGYNILPELLDERTMLIHGRNEQGMLIDSLHPGLDESFDAVILLGMHAKTGTLEAGTPHSLITVETDSGNTYELGEAGNNAAFAGSFGVPAILCSGDEAVCHEISEHIPKIHKYQTKKHFASQLACTKAPGKVRKELEDSAKTAILQRNEIPPFIINGKCKVQISDRNPSKKWPINALEQDSYREALIHTCKNVPWRKQATEIDDGWRFPDRMEQAPPNPEWN